VKIEIAPSKSATKRRQIFSAKLFNQDKRLLAEIVDAPFDIATQWGRPNETDSRRSTGDQANRCVHLLRQR